MKLKQIIIPLLSLLICGTVLYKWTLGFSAFTIFSYTLKQADPISKPFPDIKLIDQNGNVFDLKNSEKYKLVNFIYLNCPYACHKVTNQLEEVYRLTDTTFIPTQLEFVSISFDLKNDNVPKIKNYHNLLGKNIEGWRFALPYQTSEEKVEQLLKDLGIWTYRDPKTNIINHSLNIFLVSPENTIVKLFDPTRENQLYINKQLEKWLEKEKTIVSLP